MRKWLLLIFCILALVAKGESQYTLEDIEELYKSNIISKEDYDILKNELKDSDISSLYNLVISNAVVDTKFPFLVRDGVNYVSIERFFRDIGFTNYEKKDSQFDILMGREIIHVWIDFDKKEIKYDGEEFKTEEKDFLTENADFYLSEKLFKKLFLTYIDIDKKNLTITMGLSFQTPDKIKQILEAEKEKLSIKKPDEIVYRDENKFFDLGYARLSLGKNFAKTKGKSSWDKDWSGNVEYQGAFLYGELTTSYDLKNHELGDARINYNNIIKNHKIVVDNHPVLDNDGKKTREWGFFVYKDKGYFDYGQNIVIRETVPIGSRAELIYLGTVIDIQDAKDGVVQFSGDIIKNDRDYEIRVYTPDNRIYTKTIKPTRDYNRQNKSEFSYDMAWLQNVSKGGRYNGNFNVFYGLTDKLTFGGGISRDIVSYTSGDETKYGYTHRGNGRLIYGGVTNGLGYTLSTEYRKTFNTDDNKKRANKDYSLINMVDLSYNKVRLNLKQTNNGSEYDIKKSNSYELNYDITNNFRVGYYLNQDKKYSGERDTDSGLKLNADYSIKGILFSGDAQINFENKEIVIL